MAYSDKGILFLSLAGTKVAESIPRFTAFQNEVMKHPLPTVPFLPFNQKIGITSSESFKASNIWKADNPSVDTHFFPLKFRRVTENDPNKEPWYTFPYEPFISIKGKNKIVKRSVAKAQNFIGTIKEHWSQDDYDITITGILFGENEIGTVEECFPKADFEKLRDYCTWPLGIQVQCEPLQLLGINYLVVDDFDFPFTKGENVQAYELKCTSDFSADFLLEIE
jgi:hypothetical protein